MEEHQKYPSISVVIPTKNEAKNLPHVLPHIPVLVNEVILVDGNSTDDTIEMAQQLLGHSNPAMNRRLSARRGAS